MPTALRVVQQFFPQVTIIEDSSECVEIEVTKQDDKTATKKDHKTCAMAVACKRKLGLDGVIISINTAYLVKGRTAKRYRLPVSVAREVVSFDRGGGFAPGQYRLSRVPKSLRLDAKKPRRKLGRGKTGGADKEFIHHTAGIRVVLGSKASTGESVKL
jgi:hypothetical protein